MYIRNRYPDKPFPPERQIEWVRSVLELMRSYAEPPQNPPPNAIECRTVDAAQGRRCAP